MIGDCLILTNLHSCLHQITTACKFGNLVLVVSSVDAQFYKPVLGLDRTTCDSYLKTLVFQCTCIHQERIVKVLTCSDGCCAEQVGCLADITIKVDGKSLVEHTIVETYVPCSSRLPSQFVIVCQWTVEYSWVVGNTTDWIKVVITCTLLIGSGVVLSTCILLTGLTPTKSEFQVADSINIFQEFFVFDTPCEGC